MEIIKQHLQNLEDELKRRIIVNSVVQHGYFITDFSIDIIALNKERITLLVECIRDTRSKPRYYNSNIFSIKIIGYDYEKMPSWTQHLEYPLKPSNNFEITSEWDVTDHDDPYCAKGHRIFQIYFPVLSVDSMKKEFSLIQILNICNIFNFVGKIPSFTIIMMIILLKILKSVIHI